MEGCLNGVPDIFYQLIICLNTGSWSSFAPEESVKALGGDNPTNELEGLQNGLNINIVVQSARVDYGGRKGIS